MRHKKLRLRGQYFVQSQCFWAASKPTAGQEPHVVNLGAMHIHLKSPDPMITAAACSGGSHWRQPTGVYMWDTLRPITATAANQRLHMYEIRGGGGQSPLRQRPQPTSVYICKNTSRPITATAAIQCLHNYVWETPRPITKANQCVWVTPRRITDHY